MEVTYRDMAEELTRRYRAIKRTLKKGEKQKAFLLILKSLFFKYGEYFDFNHDEFSAFKSAVINARNNIRKGLKIKEEEQLKIAFDAIDTVDVFEVDEFYFYKKGRYKPKEGDGLIYTIDEVERYGLNNSGSYF